MKKFAIFNVLALLRKIIPKPIFQAYHYTLARLSAFVFGRPSRKLIVVGITGTNGKSSTVMLTAQLLTLLGEKVGYTTTAGFSIAGVEVENRMKMTMPGRFLLQKLLRRMVKADCRYAIIETSSQGIEQYRHLGINYDVAVFTNLTPEHIEAHGGFQAYKRAKGRLFSHLTKRSRKTINGEGVPKVNIVNGDDEHAPYFASFAADRHVKFGFCAEEEEQEGEWVCAEIRERTNEGVEVEVNGELMTIPFLAPYQQKNVLAAIATVQSLGFSLKKIARVTSKLQAIPGRFERVQAGQPFEVIVDYAYEPYALEALYEAVEALKPKRLLGIHGSAGGGRDVGRRYKIGRLAAQKEDVVIVTNEDPYDEDPQAIIDDVARGARDAGKKDGEDLFLILDRAKAIQKVVELAQKGDVVLLTGKGSEPVMAVAGGKKMPWSDKEAALKALKKAGYVAKA